MSNITHSYQRELIASENKTDFDKSLAYYNESRDMLLKLNIVKNVIESYKSLIST